MTETVPTTPFPVLPCPAKNRIAGYDKSYHIENLTFESNLTTPATYRAAYYIPAPAAALSAFPVCARVKVPSTMFYGGGEATPMAKLCTPAATVACTRGIDQDVVSGVWGRVQDRASHSLYALQARHVAVLVHMLRAMAADEISRSTCLHWSSLHDHARQAVKWVDLCAVAAQQEPADAPVEIEVGYPVASDIYEPVEHWWTPERARVLQALKEYSEATHADR